VGNRTAPRSPMAWQSTLGEMKAHGTRVAQTATCRCRGRWVELDVDQLLAVHGPEWMLWDRRPPCVRCGKPGHYMASPGPATPYRPLRTGFGLDGPRRAFLLGFGFTKRDITRIKAMAEATTQNYAPRPLNDLDVPYRVGAAWPGTDLRTSGERLGHWSGRVLLYWPMTGAELERWQARRPGPRRV
jgi:hypothetical protein